MHMGTVTVSPSPITASNPPAMPRQHTPNLLLGSAYLRHYLVHTNPATGDHILADAFVHGEAGGAVELLRLTLAMRADPRSVPDGGDA